MKFRWKLFLAFAGYAALIAGLLLTFVMARLRPIPEEMTRRLLLTAVANAVAEFDPEDVKTLAASDDPRSHPKFDSLHAKLREIDNRPLELSRRLGQEVRPSKDIYILGRTDNSGGGRLLVTLDPEEAGGPYDMSRFPAMMRAWDGPIADDEVAADEFGVSLSAYAPIHDSTGEAIAILGIDSPAEAIDHMREQLWIAAWVVFGVSLLIGLVPAFVIAHRLNRPLRNLSEGMERVIGGDLTTQVPVPRTGDEFQKLTAQFNRMVIELADKERIQQALALARHIQQHLLPKGAPRLHGVEISAISEYCDETGGDFFDFIPLDGGDGQDRMGVFIGDVTGHGVSAALLMTACRAMLRGQAPLLWHDLPGLFGSVNRQLFDDTNGERFVTLLFGVLDTKAQVFDWASAGHERLIRYEAATHGVATMENLNLILGVEPTATFAAAPPVPLRPGDVLLLVTDGLKDARNDAGEMFGQARVSRVLLENASRSADEIRAAIMKSVDAFRGRVALPDDLTLVVIKAV